MKENTKKVIGKIAVGITVQVVGQVVMTLIPVSRPVITVAQHIVCKK